MFRIRACLLALSTVLLCSGVFLLFSRDPSNWLTLITGVMLWFVGCVMMIVLCMIAIFREEEEEKTEIQAPPKSEALRKAS